MSHHTLFFIALSGASGFHIPFSLFIPSPPPIPPLLSLHFSSTVFLSIRFLPFHSSILFFPRSVRPRNLFNYTRFLLPIRIAPLTNTHSAPLISLAVFATVFMSWRLLICLVWLPFSLGFKEY